MALGGAATVVSNAEILAAVDQVEIFFGTNDHGNFTRILLVDYKVYFSQFDSGSWSANTELKFQNNHSFEVRDTQGLSISVGNNKNVLLGILYVDSNYENPKIYKAEYKSGAWILPADENDIIHADSDYIYPIIAATNGVESIISWASNSDGEFRSIQTSAGVWQASVLHDTRSLGAFVKGAVSIDSSNRITQVIGNDEDIMLRYFNGTSWGSLQNIGSTNRMYSVISQFYAEGKVAIAWQDADSILSAKCTNGSCAAPQLLAPADANSKRLDNYSYSKDGHESLIWVDMFELPNGDSEASYIGVERLSSGDSFTTEKILSGTFGPI